MFLTIFEGARELFELKPVSLMKDKKLFGVSFKKFPQPDPVKQTPCGAFAGFQEPQAYL